ncbi:hypothetical protein [Paracoccus halophilus]|nr:hypothetical protein [Paracoccus halophilus]
MAIVMAVLALAACNTVAGVGEDITGAARTVQGGMGGSGGY